MSNNFARFWAKCKTLMFLQFYRVCLVKRAIFINRESKLLHKPQTYFSICCKQILRIGQSFVFFFITLSKNVQINWNFRALLE